MAFQSNQAKRDKDKLAEDLSVTEAKFAKVRIAVRPTRV